MTPRGRLVARILLAVSLAGATTVHQHSLLEDADAPHVAQPSLDLRCAQTETLSLHAVARILEREACWACHWQRGFAVPLKAPLPEPVWCAAPLAVLPPGAVDNVATFTRTSRGPPVLLSL